MHSKTPQSRSRIVKVLLVLAGHLCLALAILGILLPLLPTTPFLLLAAAAYLRGSDALYSWLTNHRLLGRYLRNYHMGNGLPRRLKNTLIALLWLSISASVFFFVNVLALQILLYFIAASVSVYILRLPTAPRQ